MRIAVVTKYDQQHQPLHAQVKALILQLAKSHDLFFAPQTPVALFEALGWDVNNRSGLDERYKDVIFEDTVRVETSTKAPDYSFRIGGMLKFIVEAKKPAVNLKENPEPAYQVHRYAWSANLPASHSAGVR